MVMIGLEVHTYLLTNEKLFCKCKVEHNKKFTTPNTNICPICTAQPGSKPLLPNREAIIKTVQVSLILGCKINKKISWQRKHYSWPDLPKGFQNTFSGPHSTTNGENGKFLGIRIKECHLEEDPAAWNPETGEIDYNRSGSPLIEIVTEPDFTSSEQVAEWLRQLKATLSYIKAIDAKSGFKSDVNVSLPELKGVRVEIKNVNSIENIRKAIEAEIERQNKEVPKEQHTRRFDEKTGKTTLMRTKEQAQDYRFIQEPDLPAVILDEEEIAKIKKSLPETPQEKLKKILLKHKIEKSSAEILTKNIELVELFEKVVDKIKIETAVPWITVNLLGTLNYNKKELEDVEINPEHLIELLDAIEKEKITVSKGKEILREFIPKSFSPKEEISKNTKIGGEDEIKKIAKQVVKENKKAVEDYNSGKKEAINFLIGQVMRLSNKRADFKTAKEILEEILEK